MRLRHYFDHDGWLDGQRGARTEWWDMIKDLGLHEVNGQHRNSLAGKLYDRWDEPYLEKSNEY